MDAYQTHYASALRDLLEKKIVELTSLLATTMAPDHSSYAERVGHIRGLRFALEEAIELEQRMAQPEQKHATAIEPRRTYES